MFDLEQLRVLTEQVRPPAFASLQETARRRDRRAAVTALAGAALVVLLIVGGVLTTRSDDRSIEPVEPDPDRTQTVVDANYGDESVHRFETHEVTNTGDYAAETDLSVSADYYEGSTFAYWCSGDPDISYLVRVTGGSDDPDHLGVWRAGGTCDGSAEDHGEGYTGTGPPTGPTNSIGSQLTRFSPLPADQGTPTTVRIVLTDRIPADVAGCFDLPGGPIPQECQDESSVHVLDSAGDVGFGAVIFTRPVEYVATVAGIPVQAQASTGGTEWHFARGAESMPGTEKVTLESDKPGFVYVVQSDPQGRAECQQAYEEAEARGDEFLFEGDMDNWGCTMKEAKLRLLVDGRPVTEQFPSSGHFQGWFDFEASSLDAGHHEITVERLKGDPRVTFGLVLFEEAP
ncbi:MAG: hypothetical protein JWO11_549 [Nocardioides sp.]|nr:hypothetical protein [Nocardioides sp.]